MIGIIDYGAGNAASVKNALDKLGVGSVITSNIEKMEKCDSLILPGVGAFGNAMDSLKGKIQMINDWKKPFLGICLGMQVLFERSDENPEAEGLGIIKGSVRKFNGIRTPQIGWNKIENVKGQLFDKEGFVYFVNSYYCKPDANENVTTSTTNYGIEFVSSVRKNNFYGVQFHPEKSSEFGLKILERFARLSKC
ncbi:MAG: imidazole glycerol phosphate synthase subunit HisH [Candidatus Micrarchaeota archaeon]